MSNCLLGAIVIQLWFRGYIKHPRAKVLHLYVNFLPSGYGKPKTAAEVIVATIAP